MVGASFIVASQATLRSFAVPWAGGTAWYSGSFRGRSLPERISSSAWAKASSMASALS